MDPHAADLASYEAVTTGYYRDPDAAQAAGALRHWLRMVAAADEAQLARMMVLFCVFSRIAQVSEEAREAFEPILRAYEGPHAELAQRLREVASDASFPNALQVPIERAEVLDLLWAEFFVTGQAAPIERIFTVLDGPDRVRPRLEAWLHERSLLGGAKRRATASKLADAGLVVDLEHRRVVSPGDLDCLCFSIAERRVPIFTLLPFALPPGETMALAVKGSALWSLRLNARTHDEVARVCALEARRPGGPGRLLAIEATNGGAPFAL